MKQALIQFCQQLRPVRWLLAVILILVLMIKLATCSVVAALIFFGATTATFFAVNLGILAWVWRRYGLKK